MVRLNPSVNEISGLKFNPDRINMPKYIDGFVNMLRRMRTKHSK